MQRGCARTNRDSVICLGVILKFLFELRHFGAAAQPDPIEGVHYFLLLLWANPRAGKRKKILAGWKPAFHRQLRRLD